MFVWLKKLKARFIKDEVAKEKTLATLNKEPWVRVVTVNFEDPNRPSSGYFELDWNQHFIKQLVEAGYSGRTDEDIVDMWFNDLCRGVINDNLE